MLFHSAREILPDLTMEIIKFLSLLLFFGNEKLNNRTKQRRAATIKRKQPNQKKGENSLAKYIKEGLFIVFLIKNRIVVYSNKAKSHWKGAES
jgi:hypothetical protein